MKHVVVLAALACSGCSLYVDDALQKASAKLAGNEGEGEGGSEGEGGTEGEGEGSTGPACEDDERLVVLTSDGEDPLHVYKLISGGLVPLAPTGFTAPDGAVVTEAGDPAAAIEGVAFDKSVGAFFLIDDQRYYAVDAHTLVQVDVRTPEKVVSETGFPSFHGITTTPRYVIGAGNGLLGLDRTGAVASAPVPLQSSGSFHGAITFSKDAVTYVAGNSENGYDVLATSDPNGQPAPAAGVDDDTRFGDFGGGQARRGLAFDGTTGKLLLGNDTGVIVSEAPGFAVPAATSDFLLPHGSFVTAIGARAGKGYVANQSGDLYEIDLTESPPTTVEVSSWDSFATAGYAQQIVVGCKRIVVVIGGFGGTTIFSYDRDTLTDFGGGPEVHDIIGALLVSKTDLGLAGDD